VAQKAPQGSSHALIGGLAGGTFAFLLAYTWYAFSGAKTAVDSLHSTKAYVENAFKKTTAAAPEPSQAVKWLKQTVQGYTNMIPGASKYVDSAFEDIEKIQEKHGDEVNQIITDTYNQLRSTTKKGFSMEAAMQSWDIIQDCFVKIGKLAGSAGKEIIDNHPHLKEQFGGRFQQLQQMGEQYGPEAKKQVDETWNQVRDILAGGIGMSQIQKLKDLIKAKTEEIQKYGDQAWQKGMEQAKPLLDKQPQLKKLFEENKSKLLQGDLRQLWKKVQDAVQSGNTDDLQKFVQDQVQHASQKGGAGIEQLLSMIPGGQDLGPKLKQLQELSDKHGKEAENLVRSAMEDIKHVLSKKVEEGQQLKEKAKEDVKSS
jgi:ribosomal protein S20